MAAGQVVSCPHMILRNLQIDINLDIIKESTHCTICNGFYREMWLCLFRDCYSKVCCAKADHRQAHTQQYKRHTLFVAVHSMRVWCTSCNSYINVNHGPPVGNGRPGNRRRRNFDSIENADSDDEEMTDDNEHRANGLTGLQNCGNTCYMNAALQALSNTPPLTQFFLEFGETAIEAVSSDNAGQRKLMTLSKAYHKLMLEMWHLKKRGYVAPNGVLYGIRNVNPTFRGSMQQDTQEFLRCFMDVLHEELKTRVVDPPPGPTIECSIPEQDDEEMSDDENAEANVPNSQSLVASASYSEPLNEHSPPANEGEAGGASSQSEGDEYETCDSGVSERSSLSEETTSVDTENNRTLSNPPSPLPGKLRNASASVDPPRTGSASSIRRRAQTQYRSIISDVFDGKLLSSVQCLTCNRVSSRVEAFQDLSLPIPSRDHLNMLHQGSVNINNTLAKCSEQLYSADHGWLNWMWEWVCSWFWGPAVSLHDCLAAFFSADELKGDNMYSCERCRKLRNGIKFSKLLQLPEVLCIHLKRFRHDLYSSKISSHVTFPLEGLDLRPYLHRHCISNLTQYDLIAVICHHGPTFNNGHYTTFALNHRNENWYEFDDQCVTHVSTEVVRSCEAYVLFYRKRNTQVNQVRNRAYHLQQRVGGKEPLSEVYAVSKQWITRFNTFAEPGPIDNTDFLCHHSRILPGREEDLHHYTTSMPAPVWDYLFEKYGGGPVCTLDDLVVCETCTNNNLEPEMTRTAMENEFARLEAEMRDKAGVSFTNAVTGRWFNRWSNWVKGKSNEHPGPIDNDELLSNPRRAVQLGLYRRVSHDQWNFLQRMYGGGPEVVVVIDQNQECLIPPPAFVPPAPRRRSTSSDSVPPPSEEARQRMAEAVRDGTALNSRVQSDNDEDTEPQPIQPIRVAADVLVHRSEDADSQPQPVEAEVVPMEVEEEAQRERVEHRSRRVTRSVTRAARSRKPVTYRTVSTSLVDLTIEASDPDEIQVIESETLTDNADTPSAAFRPIDSSTSHSAVAQTGEANTPDTHNESTSSSDP